MLGQPMRRQNGGQPYVTYVVYRDGEDIGHVSKSLSPFAKWRALRADGEYASDLGTQAKAVAFIEA